MAGAARYMALLDACVLYPVALADSLMSIATAGLFCAKWTRRIEHEWTAALENQRLDLKSKLATRRDLIREAIPDWEVEKSAWTTLSKNLTLPDPDDTHVLGAAIAARADCIVTADRRDFPDAAVSPY
jgi:predicted nucleic acid-binding protein